MKGKNIKVDDWVISTYKDNKVMHHITYSAYDSSYGYWHVQGKIYYKKGYDLNSSYCNFNKNLHQEYTHKVIDPMDYPELFL